MSDLIDRQKVFDKLSHTRPEVGAAASKERFRYLQWYADKNAIKEVPSAQAWIPVSERLPENDGRFLITYHGDVYFGLCYAGVFTGYEPGEGVGLIVPEAWMPLPEPYKE